MKKNEVLIKEIDKLYNSFTGQDNLVMTSFYNDYYRDNKKDHKDDPFFSYYVKLICINDLCAYYLAKDSTNAYYCKKMDSFDSICPPEYKTDMLMRTFRMVIYYHLDNDGILPTMDAVMTQESIADAVDRVIKDFLKSSDFADALCKNITID